MNFTLPGRWIFWWIARLQQVQPDERGSFIEEIICGLFHARFVVVGTDFRFGYEKEAMVHMLADYAKRYGVPAFVIEKERYQDRIISRYLHQGGTSGKAMWKKAKEMLGYPYGVDGVVEHGKRLGRTLGFPTVNLHWPADKIVPPNGVYFSDVRIGGDRYHAISNVGVKPTVSDGERLLVESFLFGYQGDAYGKEILVEFLKYRRPERKFESVDELKRAVSRIWMQDAVFLEPERKLSLHWENPVLY